MSGGIRVAFARPEVWILTAISAALHLWRLSTPHAVVFDELYYERFAGQYLAHQFVFDVHPPLGRLMYVALARLLSISPTALLTPMPEPALRVLPAIVGALLVPLVYLLVRQVGGSRAAATLAAVAVTFDNALLVASRFIIVDVFLIAFGIGAMCAFLAGRRRVGGARVAFFILSAILAGCALSVKWTGASALGLIVAMWIIELALEARRANRVHRELVVRLMREGVIFTFVPAAIYLGAFGVHFAMIKRDGPDSRIMSPAFQRQLPGTAVYDPRAPRVSFWVELRDYHHAVRYANGDFERVTNAGSSPWYTWPIMKHPIGFWQPEVSPPGTRAMIALLGNPVVWWGGLLGLAAGLAGWFWRRERFMGRELGLAFLLGAVAINYVPFMAIARLMYLYHYLFALLMVIAFAAYATAPLLGWAGDSPLWRFADRRSAVVYGTIVALILAGFLYFLPLTYGWTISSAAFDQRFAVLHPF